MLKYCIIQLIYEKKRSAVTPLIAAIIILINVIALTLNGIFKFITYEVLIYSSVVSIGVSSNLFGIDSFKYRFLNMVTVLWQMLDTIKEPVIFIDSLNKIVHYNKSFIKAFPYCKEVIKKDDVFKLTECFKKHFELIQPGTESLIAAIENGVQFKKTGELCTNMPRKRFFSVSINPVFDDRRELLGRVVSFIDVSLYKNLLNKLDQKNTEITAMNDELTAMNEELTATNEELTAMNEELTSLNEQLKEYASTAEELAVAKERNRMARDVHDTVGHTLSLLITLLEVCRITSRTDPLITVDKLDQAVNLTRKGLNEIRRSISGLIPEKLDYYNLNTALKNLFSEFTVSGVNVEYSTDGLCPCNSNMYSDVIYRACQEALTNALRHGKATNVAVVLRCIDNRIKLFISDNGLGCSSVKKGFGLTGMEQRVKTLGGSIMFGSDGECGFNIYIEIPI